MPDLADLVKHWWKQMLIVMTLSLLLVGIITFFKPRQFLSVTTAVPASSYASDRSSVFNENIQILYSTLGTTDDLDVIVGTAQLDTVYLAVANQFNLQDHYKIKGGRLAAAHKLKSNSSVTKSGYGELKVKVWDTDKNLAPQLADAILGKLDAIHRDVQNKSNFTAVENLTTGRKKIKQELDSLSSAISYDSTNATIISHLISNEEKESRQIRRNSLFLQLAHYETLINEYQLMADSKNPVLLVVEKARVSWNPDRPKRMMIMIATAALSFIFSLLLALVLHRRKTTVA